MEQPQNQQQQDAALDHHQQHQAQQPMPMMMAPPVNPAAVYQSASLYVGDLHPDVTEALLYDIFNAVGPVASVRVCRDALHRRSLGYAYVNFHSAADAERALDTMNYTLIKDRPCRIMWSQRDPSLRKTGAGNVFVKHLDLSIDNKALYDTFSLFGNILSCKVVTDSSGKSRGYGFVHFETPEAADEAIRKINGMLIAGKEVFVGRFLKRNERPGAKEWTNVYVKNFPKSWQKDDLEDFFSACGPISSTIIMTDAEGKSRGFGFVDFVEHSAAEEAVKKDGHEFPVSSDEKENEPQENAEGDEDQEGDDKQVGQNVLVVCRAQKKSERLRELSAKFEELKVEQQKKYQGVNLYVKNLDDAVDDEYLRKEFEQFGTITSAKVMRDKPSYTEQGKVEGASKGFGFVCYSASDEAISAVTEMNGRLLFNKPIYVALAQRKDQRRAQLEAQHRNQQRMLGMPAQHQPPMFAHQPGGPAQPQPPFPPNPMMYQRFMQQQQQQVPRGGMPPPRPGGVQFTNNARNTAPVVPPQQQQQRKAPPAPRDMPLNPGMLAAATPEQRKSMIGEKLYPMVYRLEPLQAGKITGMLLEMENTDLLHLLENSGMLEEKVYEAKEVLKSANK